jgi:hypothetical protein
MLPTLGRIFRPVRQTVWPLSKHFFELLSLVYNFLCISERMRKEKKPFAFPFAADFFGRHNIFLFPLFSYSTEFSACWQYLD